MTHSTVTTHTLLLSNQQQPYLLFIINSQNLISKAKLLINESKVESYQYISQQ